MYVRCFPKSLSVLTVNRIPCQRSGTEALRRGSKNVERCIRRGGELEICDLLLRSGDEDCAVIAKAMDRVVQEHGTYYKKAIWATLQ